MYSRMTFCFIYLIKYLHFKVWKWQRAACPRRRHRAGDSLPYVTGATRSRTFKLVVVLGSSLSSYSPVTSTSRSTSSFRHLTELTGRWNWMADARWDRSGTSRRTQSPDMLSPCRWVGRDVKDAAAAPANRAPDASSSSHIYGSPPSSSALCHVSHPPPHVRLLLLLRLVLLLPLK